MLADAGDVDVLVANAGPAGHRAGSTSFSEEEVERALRVNLEAPILMARALGEQMAGRGERPHGLRRLARRQGRGRRAPPSTTRPSSGCVASRFALRDRPARPRASASRSSRPASIARGRDVRRLRQPSRPRASAPGRRSGSPPPSSRRSSATRSRSPWRRCSSARRRTWRYGEPRRVDGRIRAAASPAVAAEQTASGSGENEVGSRAATPSAPATRSRSAAESYEIHRLDALQEKFDVARLPYSIKVLLENVLRLEDGESVTAEDVEAIATWDAKAEPSVEIPFQPARVLMQDFTGVPAVVDLAAMRDAMEELGGDASRSTRWSTSTWSSTTRCRSTPSATRAPSRSTPSASSSATASATRS